MNGIVKSEKASLFKKSKKEKITATLQTSQVFSMRHLVGS